MDMLSLLAFSSVRDTLRRPAPRFGGALGASYSLLRGIILLPILGAVLFVAIGGFVSAGKPTSTQQVVQPIALRPSCADALKQEHSEGFHLFQRSPRCD